MELIPIAKIDFITTHSPTSGGLIRDTEAPERTSFLPDPATGGTIGQKNAVLRASLVPLIAGLRIFICRRLPANEKTPSSVISVSLVSATNGSTGGLVEDVPPLPQSKQLYNIGNIGNDGNIGNIGNTWR